MASRIEQETIITYNEQEQTAIIYTASPALMRKLDKFCQEQPEQFSEDVARRGYYQGEVISKIYTCQDKKLCQPRKKRAMSEEQRQASAARLRAMR